VDRWAGGLGPHRPRPGEAEAMNLDRADVFWSAISDLRAAAKAAM
jgi:DNA polymerase-3 subunit delta'